jgi:hypothetical protein
MSKLRIYNTHGKWDLNVMSFISPMNASINSVQVKRMMHHFPIKINQPALQLSVIFRSEAEYESFQKFVRESQQDAIANERILTINWPERNINNWTGVIKTFRAGGQRWNPAPRAQIEIELIDSMVSIRTDLQTQTANLWQAIYGVGMKNGVLEPPDEAYMDFERQMYGQDENGNLQSTTASPSVNPAQPGIGPGGIASGSGSGVGSGS